MKIHGAILRAGKRNYRELEAEIWPYLDHPDLDLRQVAANTLGFLGLTLAGEWLRVKSDKIHRFLSDPMNKDTPLRTLILINRFVFAPR